MNFPLLFVQKEMRKAASGKQTDMLPDIHGTVFVLAIY